jgi:tetratricopeptide (TPR) repeat protein
MGWFQRTFLNNSAARIERAEKYLKEKQFNNARLELQELDEPIARNLLKDALTGLVSLNLVEAEARFSSGDDIGATEHLELAKNFGASQSQLNEARKIGSQFQKSRKQEAQKKALKKNKINTVGSDPIWSLPADDPRLRYAIHLEGYPVPIRARLIDLGQEFAEATLNIEEGKPQQAFQKISNFIEREPAARFERARAALAMGQISSAISDLMMFGKEIGHQEVNNTHSGALLAQLLMQVGREEDGLSELNTLLKEDTHPTLKMVKAQLLEATGELEKAEKATQKLLEDFPRNLPIIRQLSRLRIKLDKRVLAANTLEAGLSTCCTPGSCSSQPMDTVALRMLAQIYLEDRVLPKRSEEILNELSKHVSEPVWEDGYLAALRARNNGDPVAGELAQSLLKKLKEEDHRRQWIMNSFLTS